jgi:hypothetical protein
VLEPQVKVLTVVRKTLRVRRVAAVAVVQAVRVQQAAELPVMEVLAYLHQSVAHL